MHLFVNDELTVVSIEPGQTLRALAQAICPPDAADRSLVVSVRCNGREMTDEQLDMVLDNPVLDFREIALQTLPLKALVLQNLNGAAELLAAANTSRVEAADLIAAGQEQEGLGKLQQLFSQWRQLQESFMLCVQAMNLSFEEMEAKGLPLCQMTEHVKTRLVELKASLQSGDLVLVGDSLRFELEDALSSWNRAINWMQSWIDGRSRTPVIDLLGSF